MIWPVLLAWAASAPALAQVGLGLAPMRLELRIPAGQLHSGSLLLSNDSSARVRIRAELLDFYFDASQTPQFGRSFQQESAFSCRSWLSLNPMELELSPEAVVPVRYTIRLPPSVSEGAYHCAAGFTTLPTADQHDGTGLRAAVRIVAAFYVVVGQPALDGALRELKLEYIQNGEQPEWHAVVVLENRGRLYFRPAGELEVLDSEGKLVESAKLTPIPVLPKREQRFLVPLKNIAASQQYRFRARVDIGAREVQEGTAVVFTHVATQ